MTVYVVQKQMRFDQDSGELVPRFNTLDLAEKWGEMKYLLSPSAHPFGTDSVIGDLHEKLKEYTPDDHLLLIGNPALIGMATAIAAHYSGGDVRFLQWSGRSGDYAEISAKIF